MKLGFKDTEASDIGDFESLRTYEGYDGVTELPLLSGNGGTPWDFADAGQTPNPNKINPPSCNT
jgi:hypothetical protein